MQAKHILICGERNAGKSTLIERLLAQCTVPVYGYFTRSTPLQENGYYSAYIYPAGSSERPMTAENHVGDNRPQHHIIYPEVFSKLGCAYLRATSDGIIAMDELGFMETQSSAFCQAVLQCLDGDIPVIAAIKSKYDVDFLNQIRTHPNVQIYTVTPENREELYHELLPIITAWNNK